MTYSIQPPWREVDAVGSHIDLSFNIQNGRLCLPILRCATNGDRRERTATRRAEPMSKGLVRSNSKRPVARSAISGNVICRNVETRSSWMLGSTCYMEYTGQIAT